MSAQKTNGSILLKLVVVLIVLAAAGYFAFRNFQTTALIKVVGRGTAVDAVTGSVTVAADGGYKEVKSEAGGKVVEAQAINKDAPFTRGAPLVRLDESDIRREIAEWERAFKATRERQELELKDNPEEGLLRDSLQTAIRLRDLGNVADEQVKTAQRALDAYLKRIELMKFDREKAEADYKANKKILELRLSQLTISAPPMDGVVLEPRTWEGALIGAGQTVAVVYANERVVAAKISEDQFGKVKVGQKARLRLLTYGEREFDAVVSKLLPTADEAQRFEIWLDVKADKKSLMPGSTGEVTITVDEHPDQVLIQRRALVGLEYVFVVKNGRVERRPVEVGFVSLADVEILKGLAAGEYVIVDMLEQFRDGQRVNVEIVK